MIARQLSIFRETLRGLSSLALLTGIGCTASAGASARFVEESPIMATNPSVLSEPRLERRSYASAATQTTRDYFLYVPKGYEQAPSKKWPVLLFLHGNGERGDAQEELKYLLVNGPLYEAWIQKQDLPFLIIAPQLPMYGRDEFADYLRDRDPNQIPERLQQGVPKRPRQFETAFPMSGAVAVEQLPLGPEGPPMGWPELESDVITILDEVARDFRADTDRQYISGVSYGGFGTWFLASRHPERFAAMAPVVGYGHPDLMPPIAKAKIPVWCFAGGRDGGVRPEFFYVGLNRLEALGHENLKFTIEADMGHDVWARVYAGQDIYSWMLQQSRTSTGTQP